MTVSNDIRYVGVNDHKIDLFEGQYKVPYGMAYNSYAIIDEKIAIMDTVDAKFTHEWLDNIQKALNGRNPDYLIIQHMEPDHSANIINFVKTYPDVTICSSAKSFTMMKNFFGTEFEEKRLIVGEGDTLSLGKHTLSFIAAPMVHWPEVMMTYDSADKVLFTADGFGTFGANDVDNPKGDITADSSAWDDEARRYYIGIVGKYGVQVQAVLKKAAGLEIKMICPLHGPVLKNDLAHFIKKYDIWSSYEAESEGIFIAYTSVYGHTKQAAELLAEKIKEKGCPKVVITDLAREDMSEAVANAFRYGKIVLATTTYNAEVFPFMHTFIDHLVERGYRKRTIGIIENGSWAPQAARVITKKFENCKDIIYTNATVHIMSALNEESKEQLENLANELCRDYLAQDGTKANKSDMNALFKIGYGLYVITTNDGNHDNGMICNAVTQVANSPDRIAVTINKQNYTHHVVSQTGIMNVNCLSVDAPFSVFENFGFRSGRNADKFEGEEVLRSDNGLIFPSKYINAFMSLSVEKYVDLDTHGMFICKIDEARVLNDRETMTYAYYQNNVKPKPDTEGKKGYVCKVCGYVYEGDTLPEDFVCPLCKHGASDFEPVG
ncbi:MAG: flavin reductase [Lachnospiraceae bacterium]|nr:flavin reductase [Lachnospiraceae bacterium]